MTLLLVFLFICFLIGSLPSQRIWSARYWILGLLCLFVSFGYYYLRWF